MPVVESDDDSEDHDEQKAKLFEVIDETVQMSEDVRDMHEDALSYYLNFTGDMIDEDGYRGYGDEDDSDEEYNPEDRDPNNPRKPETMPKKKKNDGSDSEDAPGGKPPGDKPECKQQ